MVNIKKEPVDFNMLRNIWPIDFNKSDAIRLKIIKFAPVNPPGCMLAACCVEKVEGSDVYHF